MITNGMVSFEDGKKAAEEYAPARKVRVELHFTVDGGASVEAVIEHAAGLARMKVYQLLASGANLTAPDYIDKAVDAALAETAPVPKKTRKKVEPLPAVETFPGTPAGGQPATGTGASAEGPAKVTEDLSDAALYKVVVDINQRIAKPKEITAIIEKFCPQDGVPPSLKRVVNEKRSEFLVELRAYAEKTKGGAKDEVQVS